MKFLTFLLLSLMPLTGMAQKVVAESENRNIKGNDAKGYSVELQASSEAVREALVKFMRDIGKSKVSGGVITVTSPVLGGTTWDKLLIYGQTKGDLNTSRAWMGLIPAEWESQNTDAPLASLKELVYQFGVKYYRDVIQAEIDDTQKAVDATEKKLLRTSGQGKDLASKLAANEAEKIKLDKQLELNVADHVLLLQKIEANKKSQDSLTNAAAQIRKVLDAQKEKQSKVN